MAVALFFHVAQMYEVEEYLIMDVNEEVILIYMSIQRMSIMLSTC